MQSVFSNFTRCYSCHRRRRLRHPRSLRRHRRCAMSAFISKGHVLINYRVPYIYVSYAFRRSKSVQPYFLMLFSRLGKIMS